MRSLSFLSDVSGCKCTKVWKGLMKRWWGCFRFSFFAMSTYFPSGGARQTNKQTRLNGGATVHHSSSHPHWGSTHNLWPLWWPASQFWQKGRKKFTDGEQVELLLWNFGYVSWYNIHVIARALIRASTVGPIRGSVTGVWRSKCCEGPSEDRLSTVLLWSGAAAGPRIRCRHRRSSPQHPGASLQPFSVACREGNTLLKEARRENNADGDTLNKSSRLS